MSKVPDERQPLLHHEPVSPKPLSSAINPEDGPIPHPTDRSVEHDTLPETATFGQNLTWTSAYLLTISRIVGSGIFATPGSIYRSVGSVGLALTVWIVGAAIAFCGLAVSLELGCMLPRSGGTKVYLEFMYRRPRFLASTLVAVHAVLLGFTASNCIVFGEYLLVALGAEVSAFNQRTLAVGLLTAITVVHGCFLKTGIWIQNALAWVKIGLMAFMAVLGFVSLFMPLRSTHDRDEARSSFTRPFEGSNWDLVTLSTAIFKVSYSFAGYDNVNNVLNEVKDPVRTLKTMAPTALLTVAVFYLMLNIAYFIVVPLEEINQSGELIAALFFEKIFGSSVGTTMLAFLVAISAAGNVMVVTFALARVNQEIARQGFLPFAEYLSSSYPFGAPLGGLVVHYIPSFLVVVLPPQQDVYAFILDVEGYPGTIFVMAVCIGTLWLRKSRPDLKRPFKAWKVAIWLRIALSSITIVAPFVPPKNGGDVGFWYATYAVVGGGILVCGVIYWYLWTILLPRLGGYRLEEETDVLADGTTVTKIVKVKDK
ncbi:uncharacterized protein KY384_001636 [Bacidia gigantensis]|uniref:uncharacterized protein n=1 Tax=Bacidia gigantensis TaxID=2732470 RepID=UPI001D04EFEB|nr:uncharacterized protein KY384_001636 [Bacidia gigantensis]KAG8533895.1 hypothetical protein KY384_001636 [Bacidia gigantensis]